MSVLHEWYMIARLTVWRLFMGPIWGIQLLTGYKSFRDNPIIGNPFLNACGLHVVRQKLAHHAANRRRRGMAHLIPPERIEEFERNGFIVVHDVLPHQEFDRLIQEVRAFRTEARETVQGDTITRRIALDPDALKNMPAVRRFLGMRAWHDLIRYVGSHDVEPIYYIQTILSKVVKGAPDPQTDLHADTFHPTVKAWFTLTDVKADGGPLVYVPGSHRITPGRMAWEKTMSMGAAQAQNRLTGRGSPRVTREELAGMGYGPPVTLDVPVNSLIVADTGGFHARGHSAEAGIRAEIWAYGRHNPFFSLPVNIWRIATLGQRRVRWGWAIGDRLAALGLKRQVWHPCVNRSAFDPHIPG
ncbi:phytanoyl-CoA dioxygenase family protein [Gluconacetobacter entanii]|uniref:Phytanoyl-CoA dioxygenase n=1 Tax=Gluconacetobacter entanii TaxID=108528 RepID=A0A318PW62_9PROT|nr:phytanoyl-CoA dioxygenase family protein [Gluconacetobacter entanii]PYD62556.1 phytanoyl-CoA dioxygenase [Gluconacetobacter entanii]